MSLIVNIILCVGFAAWKGGKDNRSKGLALQYWRSHVYQHSLSVLLLDMFWGKGPSQALGQPDGNQLALRGIQFNQQCFHGRSAGTPYAANVIECNKRVLCARDLLNDPRANELPMAM